MEANTNTFTTPHYGNVDEAKDELKTLGSDLNDQTSLEGHRKTMLINHVKEVKANNQDWVSRLFLPKGEKEKLKILDEKELEGIRIVLDNQNEALRAICAAQVSFIKEVVNTMLKTGRSGMQSAASAIYKENALAMQNSLTQITNRFYDLLEAKYRDAEGRLPFIQKHITEDIETMMSNWQRDTMTLQNDFSNILNEKV